ncbi:MAG: tRNA (adenosine(37)-N6)-threonylcarbamoyltransferase complex transferase subunit TsaD [Clostridia bacterium]|nr:tRNA (adenosine(37)-N6)-threonylcarbamoyltransferase complex transferase subunit TsaD [Clostridia bacterium]
MKEYKVLGIESSCDETAAAVVVNGRQMLSNVISSQIDIHRLYGGVVPEIAGRNHIEAIDGVVRQALCDANMTVKDIDCVAVTYGAGLVGALLVGLSFAKALSLSANIPLMPVNHIEGHICANYVTHKELEPPYICLLASGGHTAVAEVDDYLKIKILATTLDDAVGEAFDKVARTLGLPYPGGVEIDRLAVKGEVSYKLPNINSEGNFSYSGIKTAVLNTVNSLKQKGDNVNIENMCASFNHFAVEGLVYRAFELAKEKGLDKIAVAGGVGANSLLRRRMEEEGEKRGVRVFLPQKSLCTDNAVMIASNGYFKAANGAPFADMTLNAKPTVKLSAE